MEMITSRSHYRRKSLLEIILIKKINVFENHLPTLMKTYRALGEFAAIVPETIADTNGTLRSITSRVL